MALKKYQEEEYIALRQIDLEERARSCLLAFTLYTKPDYEVNWHHKLLCDKLNRFLSGEIQFLMVFMPPRHGKSEIISRRLPAMIHGLYPDDEIMTASYSLSLANEMTAAVQGIMDTQEYRRLFPDVGIVPPNAVHPTARRNSEEHDLINPNKRDHNDLPVKYRGKYRGQGVGGSFTGKGANWILIDDPIKGRKDADSAAFREGLWNFYSSDLRSRLEKGGQVLLTVTRWHEDDLPGRLLKKMQQEVGADKFEVLSLPAIKENDDNPDDPRKIGEALWPNKYDVPELQVFKSNSARDWASLYQQSPTVEGGTILKRIHMQKRYTKLPEKFDALVLSADLRFKEDPKSGDHVVIDCWGRKGTDFYFVDQVRGRWSFTESLTEFAKMVVKHPKAAAKYVENKANGPALESVLKKKITGLILVEPDGSKVARAYAVTHLWEAGNVWLPDAAIFPGIDAVINEYVAFREGVSVDDRVDTMTQALRELEKGVSTSFDNLLDF